MKDLTSGNRNTELPPPCLHLCNSGTHHPFASTAQPCNEWAMLPWLLEIGMSIVMTTQEFLSTWTGQDVSAEAAAAWEAEQDALAYCRLQNEEDYEDCVETVCVWADGTQCSISELSEYLTFMSDDYEVKQPDDEDFTYQIQGVDGEEIPF